MFQGYPTSTTESETLGPAPIENQQAKLAMAGISAEILSLYQQRADKLQELVDPEGTLPEIRLIKDTESEKAKGLASIGVELNNAVDNKGNFIGEIQTHSSKYTGDIVEVYKSVIGKKGKGYGTAMYLAVAKQTVARGKILTNDQSGVSPEAKNLWERLAKKGAATRITPFERDLRRRDEKYRGMYQIQAFPKRS
jgi:hypothetical protein